MSDLNFEKNIRRIANDGKEDPKPEIWDRLVVRKNVPISPPKTSLKLNWKKTLSYAACIILIASFYYIFDTDNKISINKYINRNYVTAELSNDESVEFDFKHVHSLNKAYGSYELVPKTKKNGFKLKPRLQ